MSNAFRKLLFTRNEVQLSKCIKCFPSTLRRNFKTQQSHGYRDAIVLENLRFQNENANPAFSNSSGWKSVYESLRFRDGLVWTVGLTEEIKLRFQISSVWCGRCQNFNGLGIRVLRALYDQSQHT